MPKFTNYTEKQIPEDNDTLMIYDAAAKANKLSPFSGIWNWIVKKLTNAVISNLETQNKSVIGALNELNSKAFLVKTTNNEDADNITTPGWYRCSNISNASSKFGYLLVFSLYESDRYVFQIFQDANSSSLSRRVRVSSEWKNWVSM